MPFAHPAEQELARILKFFRMRWAYEPTLFVLRRHRDGEIAEMFAPDFYLPDFNVYLELTTMRQALVTRKNRKLRLMHETHPNVRVKMLYRRDYERLLATYKSALSCPAPPEVLSVLCDADAITAAVENVAMREVARLERHTSPGSMPAIVPANSSSSRFAIDVARAMSAHGVDLDILDIEIVAGHRQPRKGIRGANPNLFMNRPVIVLDTLVSTGLTLTHLRQRLRFEGALVVDTVALFARAGSTVIQAGLLDHVEFDAPNETLAGYGLQIRSGLSPMNLVAVVRDGRVPAATPFTDVLLADTQLDLI